MIPTVDDDKQIHIVENVINELGFGRYQIQVILILGIVQSTDTMETLIQAILGPSLRCEWQLHPDYVALLTSFVFLGICAGAVPMGYLSDKYGRRSMCILCCGALVYFTFLCSFSPVYGWIAFLRIVSGLFISGLLTSSSSLISEVMPESYQSTGQLLVYGFDSLIAIYVTGIGLGCYRGGLSWRYFLFISTFPLILSIFGLIFFLHESPVLLASWERNNDAALALDEVARSNKKFKKENKDFTFVGKLAEAEVTKEHDLSLSNVRRFLKAFLTKYSWSSLTLFVIFFLWGFILYGGTTLLPVELPVTSRTCLQHPLSGNLSQPKETQNSAGNSDCCLPMGEDGYKSLFSAVIGSVLSFPIAFFLIWFFGKRSTVNICFGVTGLLLFIQGFCLNSLGMKILFFATRAVASAGYNATNIYLTELFEANIRCFAYGLTSTAYRIGVLCAPYVGQVYLHEKSALGAIFIFSGMSCMGLVLGFLLPKSILNNKGSAQSSSSEPPSTKSSIFEFRKNPFKNIFSKSKTISTELVTAIASGHAIEVDQPKKH